MSGCPGGGAAVTVVVNDIVVGVLESIIIYKIDFMLSQAAAETLFGYSYEYKYQIGGGICTMR